MPSTFSSTLPELAINSLISPLDWPVRLLPGFTNTPLYFLGGRTSTNFSPITPSEPMENSASWGIFTSLLTCMVTTTWSGSTLADFTDPMGTPAYRTALPT